MDTIEGRYLAALRSRVCGTCAELLADRMCGLKDRVCPIERNLREILQIVHHFESDTTSAYLKELRNMICAVCDEQTAQGRCELRDRSDCALDRYFGLVIDTIDEVREQIRVGAVSH